VYDFHFYLLSILAGSVAGFLSGFMGIGGGIIIIPSLFFLYSKYLPQYNKYLSQIIFGTSNAFVFINSIKNFHNYYKKKLIDIKKSIKIAICCFFGGYLGAFSGSYLPSKLLKTFFGFFLIIMATKMLISSKNNLETETKNLPELKFSTIIFSGLSIGFIAGFFGVGGGVIAVPILSTMFHFPILYAQGFSVSLIPFNSAGGVIGYLTGGINKIGINFPIIGFIDISTLLCCVIPAFFFNKLGLTYASKFKQQTLKKIFAIVLFFLAIKFLFFK